MDQDVSSAGPAACVGHGQESLPSTFETPAGASSNTVGPDGASLDLLGLTVMAMPPGRVELEMTDVVPMLVVSPTDGAPCTLLDMRADGTRIPETHGGPGRYDIHAPAGSLQLEAINHGWECLIEMDETKLPLIAHEANDGEMRFRAPVEFGSDEILAQLSTLAIDHLRSGASDRLYVEGLAIAMTARAFGLTSERCCDVSTRGTDARIARALDYAEAHLGESLSVGDLAAVANMSPSWFAQSFRAELGKPVHAYIRERRLDRARILLGQRTLTLQQVAFACGFSDQAHMTRAFKGRFGTTPAKAREDMS